MAGRHVVQWQRVFTGDRPDQDARLQFHPLHHLRLSHCLVQVSTLGFQIVFFVVVCFVLGGGGDRGGAGRRRGRRRGEEWSLSNHASEKLSICSIWGGDIAQFANCSGMVMFPVHQVLAKTILQGTVKGGRRQGRQRKRWENNVREWTGLEFGKSQRAVENREMEKTGRKIICGAPTTLALRD